MQADMETTHKVRQLPSKYLNRLHPPFSARLMASRTLPDVELET